LTSKAHETKEPFENIAQRARPRWKTSIVVATTAVEVQG